MNKVSFPQLLTLILWDLVSPFFFTGNAATFNPLVLKFIAVSSTKAQFFPLAEWVSCYSIPFHPRKAGKVRADSSSGHKLGETEVQREQRNHPIW